MEESHHPEAHSLLLPAASTTGSRPLAEPSAVLTVSSFSVVSLQPRALLLDEVVSTGN